MDVVLNDHSYNRTEQVKQLLKEIEKAPFIEQVDIAVQSTNVVSKSLKIYSLHQRQLMSDEDLATYLNNEVESLNQTKNLFIAELEEDNLFKALLIFRCHNNMNHQLMNDLTDFVKKYLYHVLKTYGKSYKKNRSDFLLDLASKLMGTHRTGEALELMIDNLRSYLPHYTFQVWMMNEVENTTLPIQLVDFNKIYHKHSGYRALFYKKIEVAYDEEEGRTIIYVPFKGKRSISGMLQINMNGKYTINHFDAEVIDHFAKMMGEVIERTRLYQSSTKQIRDLELINYTTQELNSNLDRDEIIQVIERQVNNYSYPEQYAIALRNEGTNELEVVAEQDNFFEKTIGKKFLNYASDNVERTKRPMFYGDYNGLIHDVPYKSLIVLPLHAENNYLGVLILAHSTRYYFSHDTFKLFQSIIQHASIALMNSLLKEQLKKTIITDYLTKLYTRNYIDSYVMHHMKIGERASFILYDVDDFKMINDQYGHYLGDRALEKVAQIIRTHLNDDQIAARWGGEEFAVYLPNVSLDEAIAIANNIRIDIEKYSTPQVTVSGGIASWTKGSEDSIESLFIRADEALYMAKSHGKNRIVIEETKSIQF